ncbi:modifier of rpr and grim, ubiquitously expressed [Anticarsia gemmatalis]|uniref:modifier of rpr and grim, ubiquitously expressed n=1 Tax=Anticarsia gemmatalis TaxID=129554 RepID=UPI003F76A224
MFAMGPDFFQFIKKLEENGDKLTSSTPLEQPLDFEFNNSTCYVCNGYYGPSFGEPVCVTCHAFLFPDFPSYLPSSYFCSEKTDDGDSGNDEPSDLNFSSERKVNRAFPLPAWWYYRSSLDSETSPEDEASRASNSGAGASSSGNGGSGSNSGGAGSLACSGAGSAAGSSLSVGPSSGGGGAGVGGCSRGTGNGNVGNTPGGYNHGGLGNGGVGNAAGGPSRPPNNPAASGSSNAAGGSGRVAASAAGNGGPSSSRGAGDGSAGSSASSGSVAGSAAGSSSRPDPAPEESAGLGPPPLLPSLARSLQALSTPRPPDNLAPGLVEQLPSEVLLCIFSYLDDLSLCACAVVCARWWRLVRARVAPPRWAAFTSRRFPLYRPLLANIDWHKKYQSLVESCFCRSCLVQMCVQAQPAGEENAWRRNRLNIEVKMLRNDPPEGIAARPLDAKSCHWQASVTGPVGSPYEGGVFYLYIQVPYAYPMSPPVVRFLTRILHPNISRHGDVGIDSVHHNWSLALTISKVLISIQSLLTDPYTAVCMEPELGEMYVRDRARFESLARTWTWRYAMHDIMPQ